MRRRGQASKIQVNLLCLVKAPILQSVLNVKTLVLLLQLLQQLLLGAFNQEKALDGTFSVILQTDGSLQLYYLRLNTRITPRILKAV